MQLLAAILCVLQLVAANAQCPPESVYPHFVPPNLAIGYQDPMVTPMPEPRGLRFHRRAVSSFLGYTYYSSGSCELTPTAFYENDVDELAVQIVQFTAHQATPAPSLVTILDAAEFPTVSSGRRVAVARFITQEPHGGLGRSRHHPLTLENLLNIFLLQQCRIFVCHRFVGD